MMIITTKTTQVHDKDRLKNIVATSGIVTPADTIAPADEDMKRQMIIKTPANDKGIS